MPSKEDLTEQLALMAKLAAQVERMSAAAEKLEQSYTAQVDAVQKLANAFGQVNTQGAAQGVDVLNKSLRDMQDRMKSAGRVSESTFQKLGKKVEEAGKNFKERFPKSVLVATGAISGFAQGVRNVVAMGKGVTDFLTGFIDGVTSLAVSIVTFPLKVFERLVDFAAKSAGGSNELAQAIENLRKEFGYLYGPTNKTIIDMSKSLKGFAETGLSAWRVFGNMAQRLEAFQKLASEMGATFTSLRKEFDDNGGAILAYQKGLGLSEEQMKAISQKAISMGDTLGDTLKETTKYSLEMAKAFGLDAKVISRDMVKAMQDVKHFAGATTQEIGQAATYARKLGLELDKITGTLDAFETFDSAAENVAKLSQSFGVTVDAFKLMQAQDPAEQIDMLRKSFAKAGVDASGFNRQQLKLLSSTTGLDEATARQAFSMKNQGVGLDQIKKKGAEAEKKTLTQAQAMGKLADAIERLTMPGGAMEGGFWDQFVKGIGAGIQSSKEFWELMRNIRVSLRDVYFIGVKLGRDLVKIVPGFQDLLQGMADFFKPAYFDKLFRGISDSVRKFFDPHSTDKHSIPRLVQSLQKTFKDMFTVEGSAGKRVLEGFKKFFKAASAIGVSAIEWLADSIKDGLKGVVDLLTGHRKLNLAGAKGAGAGALGFLGEIVMPLIDALKKAGVTIKPALISLLTVLAEKAWGWVKDNKEIFEKIGLGIMAYIFGMALVRAAAGLLAKVVVDAAASMLSKAVGFVLRKIGGEIMADMFQNAPTEGVSKSISGALKKAVSNKTSTVGAEEGASLAGPVVARGMWSRLVSFITTVPSALAAAGAAALGVGLSAIAAAAVAAYATNTAADMQKNVTAELTKAQLQITNASSKNVSLLAKKQALEEIDAMLKAKEDALKEKKTGISGYLDSFREAFEVAFNPNHTTTEDQIAKLRRQRDDFRVQVEKLNADEAKKLQASENSQTKFMGETTLDDAKGRIESLEGLSKKLMGKNFDIQKMIDGIKEKFKGISFDVLSADQAGSLGSGVESLKKVNEYVGMLHDTLSKLSDLPTLIASISAKMQGTSGKVDLVTRAIGAVTTALSDMQTLVSAGISRGSLKELVDNMNYVATVISGDGGLLTAVNSINALIGAFPTMGSAWRFVTQVAGLKTIVDVFPGFQRSILDITATLRGNEGAKSGVTGALQAVSEMVKQANDLDAALADGNVNKIDVKAKLEKVARAVGLGGKVQYTVNPSKQVQIVLNLEVSMDVDKVEKVMIMRQQSIIRDRINFATQNPSEHGNSTIPGEFQNDLPIIGGGTK